MSLRCIDAKSPFTEDEHVSVTVVKGAVGGHVGLLYRVDDDGRTAHVHLAFHHQLHAESTPIDMKSRVVCSVSTDAQRDVSALARRFAKTHANGQVPYALKRGATVDSKGALSLNGMHGLTCSLTVLVLFEGANICLLDYATWDAASPERKAADVEAQAKLVSFLEKRDRDHAAKVRDEVGCARFRAEEVAASSGMGGHPLGLPAVEGEGEKLLASL